MAFAIIKLGLRRAAGPAVIVLFLLFSYGCQEQPAQNSPGRANYIVATDTTLIPMSFVNDKSQIAGFEPDLMQAIADRAGFDIELTAVDWPGLFGGLITRKFDMVISSVTILPERKDKMAFSVPYLKSGISIVVKKDTEGVTTIDDIIKQNLLAGAQVGTTAYFFLEKYPNIRKKGYQLYGHAVADLINGEVDAVLGESTATLYYKNQQKDYFQKIKTVGDILTDEYYGIVLRKEDTKLLAKVNAALETLLADGTVEKLHAKWNLGNSSVVPKIP